MIRKYMSAVSALFLLALGTAAYAEGGRGIEAGMKMWLNQWTQDAPGSGRITSDSTMLLGPALEAKFANGVFAEAAYLFSAADYNFSEVLGPSRFSRQDAHAEVGYMIIPEFGLAAGYRSSTFRQKEAGTRATLAGPVAGMRLNLRADEVLAFYGKLNYLFTAFHEDDAVLSLREDSPGWALEFGATYAFTRRFSGSLGYRYETNKGLDTQVKDSFSGLTLGGLIVF